MMTLWDEASHPDDERWAEIEERGGSGGWQQGWQRRRRTSRESPASQFWEEGEPRATRTRAQPSDR